MSDRRQALEFFEAEREATAARVAADIEKYRKGDATVTVTDAEGRPIPGARVLAVQRTHEFRFGANLFMLEELESEEKNEKYKQYFAEIFNIATLPFYWKDLEPTPGNRRFAKDSVPIYRRPPIDRCIEYCRAHGIEPREHCLNYESWIPDWLINEPVGVIKEKLEERIRILAERYGDVIPRWEVTNETLYNRRYMPTSAFYHERDYVEWSFKTAAKYLKSNTLIINDAHCNVWSGAFNYDRSAYYMQIERAIAAGAKIDAIGLQFHMFFNREHETASTRLFYRPSHLFDVMDTYAALDRPLGITEITVPAYSGDPEDEAIQAEILEHLYSIWFSHPRMQEIIYWNLVDGYAAFAPQGDMTAGENRYFGGLLRFDLSPKPAYYKLRELICERWHTETDLVTDALGACTFRGFYGRYELTVEAGGQTVRTTADLSSSGDGKITVALG